MFKNKRIVAMVLCALMLFVPVAAMAMTEPSAKSETQRDYLWFFYSASTVGSSKLSAAVIAYEQQLQGSPWTRVTDAATAKTERDALAEKVKAYKTELEKFDKELAKAASAMNDVKRFGYKKFIDKSGEVYGSKTEEEAKANFEEAVKNFEASKAARDAQVKKYEGLADFYKFALEAINIAEKAATANTKLEAARDAFKSAASFYMGFVDSGNANEEQLRALAAPMVLKAWNNYAALASDYEKASLLDVQMKEVRELIQKNNTKYEMMSTGEKGWILADEAKNGCLEKVAEFKVEKKDGKFVAKVYGADGKEIVLKQQLTVYRPIGKDVKVLKAKVDGKDVTFAISTRGEQSYVSVPVVY